MIKFVFLDIDGVLTNIVEACSFILGRNYNEVMNHYKEHHKGEFNLSKVFNVDEGHLWGTLIANNQNFWTSMRWMDDGFVIFQLIEEWCNKNRVHLFFLTAPTRCPQSASGKIKWIYRNIPKTYWNNIIIGRNKFACAGPHAILVDDNDKNVKRFTNFGGNAILVPRIWNEGHQNTNVIEHIQNELKKYG